MPFAELCKQFNTLTYMQRFLTADIQETHLLLVLHADQLSYTKLGGLAPLTRIV